MIKHGTDGGTIHAMFSEPCGNMRHVGTGLDCHALPVLGQVGEHREQHEPADEIERLVKCQRIEPAVHCIRACHAAMPVDRRRADILSPPIERFAAQLADDIAQDATEKSYIGILCD